MQYLNGSAVETRLRPRSAANDAITQLIKPRDVAQALGVSVSWVIQHASGKRRPYLPAVKMGAGRSPLRFDPQEVEKFIEDCRQIGGRRLTRRPADGQAECENRGC